MDVLDIAMSQNKEVDIEEKLFIKLHSENKNNKLQEKWIVQIKHEYGMWTIQCHEVLHKELHVGEYWLFMSCMEQIW